ncbi:MAG: ribonuclease Z [Candidatus Aenigmarchaeota archaeon]|nr:ribonuclease Z [Candidatus Aenigmarchaeota archaeon]
MTQIDVVILGSGSAIPTPERGHPSTLLNRSGELYLFDCGEGTQTRVRKAGYNPQKIKSIFISHWHADHFSGLLPLFETLNLLNRKEPLTIFGPQAERFVSDLFDLSYYSVGFPLRAINCSLESPQKLVSTLEYDIFSVPVKHSVPAVGYFFKEKERWNLSSKKLKTFGLKPSPLLQELKEKGKIVFNSKKILLKQVAEKTEGRSFAYSGDTQPFKPFFKFISGCDLLIHDSTFLEPVPTKSHSSAAEAAKLSKQYKIKRLVLSHFSQRYKSEKELLRAAKKVFPRTIAAFDGLKLFI